MASVDLSINVNAAWKALGIGAEQQPIIVIDNLLNCPQAFVDLAADATLYAPTGNAYPGQRGAAPVDFNRNLYAALSNLLGDVFGAPLDDPLVLESTFAMVTRPANNLRHRQRIPHIDITDPRHLAMVLYLCDESFGGTSFFRHNATGFETISPDRAQLYGDVMMREMNSAPLPSRFPDETNPFFTRTFNVGCCFNRAVFFRSQLLHAPAIPPGAQFSEDPRKGRLTITSFLRPKSESEDGPR